MLNETSPAREALPVTVIGTKQGGELTPVEPVRDSPVLLHGRQPHSWSFTTPSCTLAGLDCRIISLCALVSPSI